MFREVANNEIVKARRVLFNKHELDSDCVHEHESLSG